MRIEVRPASVFDQPNYTLFAHIFVQNLTLALHLEEIGDLIEVLFVKDSS